MLKRFDAASSRFAARRDPTARRIDPSHSKRLDAAPNRRGPPETARARAEAIRSLTDSTPHESTRLGRDDSGPHEPVRCNRNPKAKPVYGTTAANPVNRLKKPSSGEEGFFFTA